MCQPAHWIAWSWAGRFLLGCGLASKISSCGILVLSHHFLHWMNCLPKITLFPHLSAWICFWISVLYHLWSVQNLPIKKLHEKFSFMAVKNVWHFLWSNLEEGIFPCRKALVHQPVKQEKQCSTLPSWPHVCPAPVPLTRLLHMQSLQVNPAA